MKRLLFFGAVLFAAACTSTSSLERSAIGHDQRAAQLEAEGRYDAAADERDAAAKQRAKAAYRAVSVAQSPVTPPPPLSR
jgi:plasmid replication initiation protein